MRVTLAKLKEAFTSCEQIFGTCWKTLDGLKNAKSDDKDLVHNMIMFQENLAIALFNLQKLRNEITAEKRRLIDYKAKYKKEWFTKTMQRLSYYIKGVDQVVNIGKALGDSFAFFFYRSNLDLLEKQYFHKRIPNFVSGTGGYGEIAFVQKHKHLDGKLALYHGITNILRYGDFSFVDLQTHEITEIGELKTRKLDAEKNYELSLTLIGVKTLKKPLTEVSNLKMNEKLDQRTADKLKRQVEAIISILKPRKEDNQYSKNLNGLFYFSELQKLYRLSSHTKPALLQVSNGLLFAGIKLPRASLFTRIFNRKTERLVKGLSDQIIESVRKLLKPGSPNNAAIIGQLLYNPDYTDKNTPGTIPLFWYPLSSDLIKDLYFSQFMVICVFNPVHIIEELQGKGYHVSSKYLSPESQKNHEGFKKGIQQFDLFISYIMNYLQSEDTIINSIVQAETIIKEKGTLNQVVIRPQFIFESLFKV